jgi:hypothetical protein
MITLDTVTVPSKVNYQFNLDDIRTEQVTADRQLFDALNVVNQIKAQLAAKKASNDDLSSKLAQAETDADKAAANAAKATAER